MTQTETTRWCPYCARPRPHAPLPQIAGDAEMIRQLSTAADPRGFFGRYYCLECRSIWRSVELPVEFVESLLAQRPKLEELKREIALLRFWLANQRQGAPDRQMIDHTAGELHRRAA
jgi:hypothetical protein